MFNENYSVSYTNWLNVQTICFEWLKQWDFNMYKLRGSFFEVTRFFSSESMEELIYMQEIFENYPDINFCSLQNCEYSAFYSFWKNKTKVVVVNSEISSHVTQHRGIVSVASDLVKFQEK